MPKNDTNKLELIDIEQSEAVNFQEVAQAQLSADREKIRKARDTAKYILANLPEEGSPKYFQGQIELCNQFLGESDA